MVDRSSRGAGLRLAFGSMALGVVAGWLSAEVSSRRPVDLQRVAERIDVRPERVLVVVAGDPDVARDVRATFGEAKVDCVDVAGGAPIPDHGRVPLPVSPRQLVSGGGPYELIIFARSAHAVDDALLRNAMFTRARTLLADGGSVVVLDRANDVGALASFGPSALRFPNHAQWHAVFGAGGLRPVDHTRLPGPVHCWILQSKLSPV